MEKMEIWWEPCIMKVSPFCLLPDTICGECTESIDKFYLFIKNCLQNIIILENQYDILESTLKSKQKRDKACYVDFNDRKISKGIQTDHYLDVLSGKDCDLEKFRLNFPQTVTFLNNDDTVIKKENLSLVEYDVDTDSSLEASANNGKVVLGEKLQSLTRISKFVDSITNINPLSTKSYFDDSEKNLIEEISQRKSLKRKNDCIEIYKPKIFKLHTSNRRKSKAPKKIDTQDMAETVSVTFEEEQFSSQKQAENSGLEITNSPASQDEKLLLSLPQNCLLCESQLPGTAALASHVFEAHGIDLAEVVSSGSGESCPEKSKKKIPNLVKISDLKRTDSVDDAQLSECQQEPPTLHPSFVCPNCPGIFTSKQDLMMHLRLKHVELAAYLCGICSTQCTSYVNLKNHLEICSPKHQITTKYVCQVCHYGDNNFKWLENHILAHDFLLEDCKRQLKMFDPEDYIDTNENMPFVGMTSPSKGLSCNECGISEFQSFKEFSCHRRNSHSIFHCDLCNKFYGRNSHLWKHVNRLHKGHPSITCQLCYKTSASKYHLSQHFNKIHLAKVPKQKNAEFPSMEKDSRQDFMLPQFPEFDAQSIGHIQEQKSNASDQDYNSTNQQSDAEDPMIEKELLEINQEPPSAPKEIDSSHDLYNNIITNYTPPVNEGDFKCPKCSKAFHKRVLLKKHKKNCRPKMQKDLLTRCKTCSRIFKDRQSLTKHLVNYHSEYTCEICSEKVQSKCEIVSHIRFRHPGCHLFCKICKNILRSKYDLQEHMRDHLDSYVCQFCGDALPSKIKLKMHILSLHRKILSLSCGICLKLFETQHILRDHVRLVHKNQLVPLTSCPVCGKNYGSKWKTYDHLNKSHGRIFKACKTCLEVFENDAQLQAHCDVTGHGSQNSNVGANTTKKNIKSHVTSAIMEAAANNDVHDVEESDSDEEVESESEYEAIENEQYANPEPEFFLSHDKKMSLLEKRLLGKTVNEDAYLSISALPTTTTTSAKKNKPCSEAKKATAVVKKEEESERNLSPSNPHTNSSKRTVYVNSNDPSYCEICFKTWPAKKHLWQHYIRCHKAVAATVCGICLKTNESYESLQSHLRDTHPTLLHGQGFGSNFICRICGRYHNASSKLRLHMVIHENFDWKVVEDASKPSNGYKDVKEEPKKEDFDESINYESLIEQVECSSQSENGEFENECLQGGIKECENGGFQAKIKQDPESSSVEDDSNDSVMSDMSLPAEDLTDVAGKDDKQGYVSTCDDSSSSCTDEQDAASKSTSSDDDDCSQGSQSLSSQSKFNNRSNTASVDSTLNSNVFGRKPEELDSAIKSISFECTVPVNSNSVQDFCEIQSNCLNEHEIESAVGSIL